MHSTKARTLLLELSEEQHERIELVSGLLKTSPKDFGRLMIFSGLDSELDWEEFNDFVQACLDRQASGSASDGPVGTRVEDQAPHRHFRLLE